MKILGLCLSRGRGGLELYAYHIINSFHYSGYKCAFALSPKGYIKDYDWSIPVIRIKPDLPLFPLLSAIRLARYIDKNAIDVIHMHWSTDLNLAVLAKMLSKRRIKIAYSRHMGITRNKKDIYHRLLYKHVDVLLTNALFVKENAIRFLPMEKERIRNLYLGVKEPSNVKQYTDKTVFSKENPFVIGMIGRIEYGKGQHVLIDALAKLKEKQLHCFVSMAGAIMDNTYMEDLNKKIVQNGLTSEVKYHGILKEPTELMAECNAVVLTTYYETFGLVLVEAMRTGTAVIGSNAGGVPEIIEDQETGLLYEPGNSDELSKCIEDLYLNEKKRIRLALSGKEYADRKFNEEKHFKELEKIFENLGAVQ